MIINRLIKEKFYILYIVNQNNTIGEVTAYLFVYNL